MIYSSGSIAAQKLLFAYTDAGDLTPLIAGYFDTTTAGPKTLASSYDAIFEKSSGRRGGREEEVGKAQYLFLSDNVLEVRAALEAGMRACVVVREGNAPLGEGDRLGLTVVEGFGEVVI
jgi:enolase-phosphatase E1